MADYDHVIVGAGSAGCVLANRLSADPNVTVALIEAGGSNAHPYVRMPRGVGKLMAMPAFMYFYMTQPEPHNVMRPDVWLRGKGLGGSSAVNGMVWVRGHPADYEALAAATSDDWNWAHIGKSFEAIENHELGLGPSRGGGGPLRISLPTRRDTLTDAITGAGARMGWSIMEDVNAPDAGDSVGLMPRTIWKGKRQSAAVAFLDPVKDRPNLTVITDAVTDRVLFDARRAIGVAVSRGGESSEVLARREVILCAGAVASPGVLERSGIGDPKLLATYGIPLVHANSDVGEHVIEHRALRMQWRLNRPLSHNRDYAGWRLAKNVLHYYLTGGGPMSVAAIDMRASFRSRPDLNHPNIQAQIGLYSWDFPNGGNGLESEHGICAVVNPISPVSEGSIHIASRDPHAMPVITANYGVAIEDREATAAAARVMRRFVEQEPLCHLVVAETAPGPAAQSDDGILAAMDRDGCAGMHAVGSCRMGRDQGSVVDPDLRVRGVEQLRIADASVLPLIPSGNTNAPVIAMAWRAAEIIQRARTI